WCAPRRDRNRKAELMGLSPPRKRGPIFQRPVVMGPRFRGDDSRDEGRPREEDDEAFLVAAARRLCREPAGRAHGARAGLSHAADHADRAVAGGWRGRRDLPRGGAAAGGAARGERGGGGTGGRGRRRRGGGGGRREDRR